MKEQENKNEQLLEAICKDLRALHSNLIDKYDFEKLGGALIIACSLPVEGEDKSGHILCVQGKRVQVLEALEVLLDSEATAPLMAYLKLKKAIVDNPDTMEALNEFKAAMHADENNE